MKFFLALAIMLMTSSAYAGDVQGRMSFTLQPAYGNGIYGIDIRNEDGKILGKTFFGPSGMINLGITDTGVKGWAGGAGATDLSCAAIREGVSQCSGLIAGRGSKFTITEEVLNNGKSLLVKGSINHHHFEIKRNVYGTIEVNGRGGMKLKKQSEGEYSGQGMLNANMHSRFSADMKTEGNMLEMSGLMMTVFLAAPLTLL